MNGKLLAGVGLAWLALAPPAPAQSLSYTTSWIGNTFGGTSGPGQARRHVPLSVDGLFVLPDGTCCTNSGWDEDGAEAGFFKNGDIVGSAGHTHGWGYGGGAEVAANRRYLFLAQTVGNEGGGLVAADTWPAKGLVWSGVSRRTRGGGAAPFPGGKGGHGDTLRGCFLPLAETREGTATALGGLAADDTHLYLSDAAAGEVAVYDPETMTRRRGWPLPRAGRIALAADSTLWIIQRGDAGHRPRVVHRTGGGASLGEAITDVAAPSALGLDSRGRLLVADDGPGQQVRVYDVRGPAPRLAGTLGEPGGIFAGPGARAGRDGALRFNGIRGVGGDAQGNVYVASSGGGTVLESYAPTGKRNWRLLGLEFVDSADADPASDGRDVYTREEHFAMDYARTVPGGEWTYRGSTLDRFRYPDDPRLHTSPASAFVRRVAGRLFLFTTDMYADTLTVSRFDRAARGEVAIPTVCFAKHHEKGDGTGGWPPSQPDAGEWIWRDANGDGAMQAGEYLSRPGDAPPSWGWSVDSRGGVWQATDRAGLRCFPCGGLDAHGGPRYSYASMRSFPMPPDFTELCRAEYVPETDTLFLAGYTLDHPHLGGEWGAVGSQVLRYDGWNKGVRQPAVRIMLPYDGKQDAQLFIKAMCIAGDYLFAAESRSPERVFVYDVRTGLSVGTMQPGASVGKSSGWIDTPYGVRAVRRANGEYEVFVEEDLDAKVILYRWKPTGGRKRAG